MSCRVKICGISESESLHTAVESGASFIGFVHFPKSPRHVSLAHAAQLRALLPPAVASVVVVVDADDALLANIIQTVSPSLIQLHGHESVERVAEIRTKFSGQQFIKAIPISSGDDIANANAYAPYVDILLFDAKPPKDALLPGGNGLAFDWALLKNRIFPLPWLLSGGLHSENVREAIAATGAQMVDVSSGVERAPGVKDAGLIKGFIETAQA